jgi:hypothetical protein
MCGWRPVRVQSASRRQKPENRAASAGIPMLPAPSGHAVLKKVLRVLQVTGPSVSVQPAPMQAATSRAAIPRAHPAAMMTDLSARSVPLGLIVRKVHAMDRAHRAPHGLENGNGLN